MNQPAKGTAKNQQSKCIHFLSMGQCSPYMVIAAQEVKMAMI